MQTIMDSISGEELISPFPMNKQFFIPTNPGEAIQDHYDIQNATVSNNIFMFKIKYCFGKVIGEGSYGKVVKALRKNKMQLRAIKIISKSRVNDPEKFKTEMDILKDLVSF